MTLVIGIGGRAKTGKTTIAEAITEHAFSKSLTSEIYDIGALVLQYCIQNRLLSRKTRPELDRDELKVLVEVGAKMREEDINFWIGRVVRKMDDDKNTIAVIPNLRYASEIFFLRERYGTDLATVRVELLNSDGSPFISEDRPPNDPSETQLHNFDFDHFIKTKRGESALAIEQATTLFEYLLESKNV